MFGRKHEPLFEIDMSTSPPSCLPTAIDKSDLIDITAVGDSWKKYLSPNTGRVHDGAEYFNAGRWRRLTPSPGFNRG